MIINAICLIIGCIFAFMSLLSIILQSGTLSGILISGTCGVFCILFSFIDKIFKSFPNKIKIIIFILIIIYVISFIIISLMIYNFPQNPSYNHVSDTTIVVLGARIKGYNPSQMLSWRLNIAYKYLNNNPNLKCVVTGGQGPDEVTAEGIVMKDYLVKKGISPDRIYIEDKAKNTKENLNFSKNIIEKNNLSKKMLIITTDFHCMRSSIIASRLNIEHITAGAVLPLRYRYPNYVREYFAVIKSFIFDR